MEMYGETILIVVVFFKIKSQFSDSLHMYTYEIIIGDDHHQKFLRFKV